MRRQRSCPHSVGMAAAALWGYPCAPCPLRIWGMCLMVGPSALELTPSSWLFPDLLPLRVLGDPARLPIGMPRSRNVLVVLVVAVCTAPSSSHVAT